MSVQIYVLQALMIAVLLVVIAVLLFALVVAGLFLYRLVTIVFLLEDDLTEAIARIARFLDAYRRRRG